MAVATTTLLIAAMVAAAASAAYTGYAASEAAAQQKKAADQKAQDQYAELTRQQAAVDDQAKNQKSDRMRQADQQLATLRVDFGEAGQGGTASYDRMVNNISYVEGMDLSRVEANRTNDLENLQASKVAAQHGAQNDINLATMQAQNATVGAGLQFAGTALSLGTSYNNSQAQLAAIKKNGTTSSTYNPST